MLRGWLAKLQNNNSQGEYYLTDIVSMAVQQGVAVHTVQPAHEWEIHGINSKSQLMVLERTWQLVEASRLLVQGVTLADAARIDVRGKLSCGRDVEIDVGCIFEGEVSLGDNVRVGAYSVIRNSSIAHGTEIAPYSHIDSSEVGANCHIGPYARLRPGTRLHDEVHIGNFVEVKNSEIAAHSKANHLSYIGDSTVGSRVNIGAGTITCNYDGANKHRTIIEDDVFIGSDTQLVAPVTVGKGATIGAGTTVWKDAPAGELTMNDKTQSIKPGWKRPSESERKINMCGIVGAVAQRNVVPILLEGLQRLEYRGYDSAGLVVVHDGQLERVRSTGRVADLTAKSAHTQGLIGIAHTRWATHGVPSERNAHPHISKNHIAVVHNGIIENYEALRTRLTAEGYEFTSDTDTEVIAHLIHSHYARRTQAWASLTGFSLPRRRAISM